MKAHLIKTWKSLCLKWLVFKSYIPEKLPQGMKEFDRWVHDVSALSELPINDKLKKVIGTLILQMPPAMNYCTKNYIVALVQKAAANQVSVEVLSLIDEKEKTKDTVSVN